jgi:hypothetical protein
MKLNYKMHSPSRKNGNAHAVDDLVALGMHCHQAYARICLSHNYYVCFMEVLTKFSLLKQGGEFVTKIVAWKTQPGYPISPRIICHELCWYIFETRQGGIQVSTCMVCQAAFCLLPSFGNKYVMTRKVIAHIMKTMALTHRAVTHTMQKNYKMEEESKHFITMIKDNVAGIDPCDIINMVNPQSLTPIIQARHLK